ncbi:hypothetical protein PLESTB_001501600 [Pleodorina starrii]|uniref:Serine aminopeptidase S33 domain-containing protein n=1 Tax=Pleodorina starrii TaxID=330485 RepID=A0A9W6BXZ3_9CHLO|nr:hypothetical protein PLESTB_001501600 [Pleodorina starrii]
MGKVSGSFKNARGQKLYTAEWTPDAGDVKAVLFWNHGFGEYIDRFDASAKIWTESGIAMFGFDAHGMGLSEPFDEPSRALIRRFSHLVDDAVQYMDEVLKPALAARGITAPIFIAGDSLGGLVASYVVLQRPEAFAGLVMQSPAIDVEWTPLLRFQAAIGNVLAAVVPRAKLVPAVRPEDMSQDPAVVKEYLEDPMIYKGNVKALSGNEILKAFRGLSSKRAEFKLPILAVHGTADRCTSLPAVREMLKHVSSTDVKLIEVEGGYHELLMGPEKEQVRAGIRDWLLAHAEARAEAVVPADEKADAVAAEDKEAPPAAAATAATPAEAPEAGSAEAEAAKEGVAPAAAEGAAAVPAEAEGAKALAP